MKPKNSPGKCEIKVLSGFKKVYPGQETTFWDVPPGGWDGGGLENVIPDRETKVRLREDIRTRKEREGGIVHHNGTTFKLNEPGFSLFKKIEGKTISVKKLPESFARKLGKFGLLEVA